MRGAILICVSDVDPEPGRPLAVVQRAKRPVSWATHLDGRMDAFAHGERKHIHLGRCRHYISIEREHGKAVAREMEVDIPRASRMNKVELHALAGLHADCVTGAERLVPDRKEDFLIMVQGCKGSSTNCGTSGSACG